VGQVSGGFHLRYIEHKFSVRTNNDNPVSLDAAICDEVFIALLTKHGSISKVYDVFFLFGRREHAITKGLFVDPFAGNSGKFYLEPGYLKSKLVLIFDNAESTMLDHIVTDTGNKLKYICVNNNNSLKQA